MEPFAPNATCEKCGHNIVHTLYQESGCAFPARCGVRWDGPEHLDRTCQRCHYQWAESVLRSATSSAGAEGGGGREGQ